MGVDAALYTTLHHRRATAVTTKVGHASAPIRADWDIHIHTGPSPHCSSTRTMPTHLCAISSHVMNVIDKKRKTIICKNSSCIEEKILK